MQIFFRQLCGALLVGLFSSLSYAQLEVQPHLKWKVIRTAHFQVIYNAEQQDLGMLYAEKLEKAYYQLRSYFSEAPENIPVIINDKTDVTNGYATRRPYPFIMAYPVLPGPQDSLSDTGDWAFELLSHEYSHILTFEPANGVMKPLRAVFGSIISPNMLMPTWWLEGLAVNMETRLSNFGRLRSSYQDAALRAMVEDDSLYNYNIAEINEVLPSWPEGMRPYLFGSLMWSQMIADGGDKFVDELMQRQGRRVPYFIEAPMQDMLGKKYPAEYVHALEETSNRVTKQLQTLADSPVTTYVVPKNRYLSISAPTISPDGLRMAVITEDDSNSRAIKVLIRDSLDKSFLEAKETDTIEKFNEATIMPSGQHDEPLSGSIQRVSWFPDSQKIIYDKIDATNRIDRFSDLYTYDLEKRKTEMLARGLRAREPAVSPDGQTVAFVKVDGGHTHLAIMKVNEANRPVQILWSAPLQERISYPTFWNADTIIYSLRKTNGAEHLVKFSISKKTFTAMLEDYPNARFPVKTHEGLMFASNQNGVPNLYLAKDTKTARPLTHASTAFFSADLDPQTKELFATVMTAQGVKVGMVSLAERNKVPATLPKIDGLMADRFPAPTNSDEATTAAQSLLKSAEVTDYSPYGYLWPHYWFPTIATSTTSTGLVFQAETTGFDPLKKHTYTLIGSWDTAINRGSIEASYLNQTTTLPFILTTYDHSSYLGDVNNIYEDKAFAGAVLPDMFWLSKFASLQIGAQYIDRSTDISTVKRAGPYMMLSYANYTNSGAQVSPESGGGAYFGVYDYLPIDDYLHHSQFMTGGEIYMSSWLPKHNSFMLKAKGTYIPEKVGAIYGASTTQMEYIPDNPLPEYLLRGYVQGELIGRNLVSTSAEYRFPLLNVYRGSGTDPFFIHRLSGAIVADGAATDGLAYNDKLSAYQSVSMKDQFYSAGVEVKLETTIGYSFPINFVAGYYYAFNLPTPGGMLGLALQISGF